MDDFIGKGKGFGTYVLVCDASGETILARGPRAEEAALTTVVKPKFGRWRALAGPDEREHVLKYIQAAWQDGWSSGSTE